jgi:hypothetical protein
VEGHVPWANLNFIILLKGEQDWLSSIQQLTMAAALLW